MYGGMNGMYGGGGGGMYGQQGGMMGPGDPNDPNSLTNVFSQNTQATFQIIENLVGAFGGVAQMLESTYMATHSSFFGEWPLPPSQLQTFHTYNPSTAMISVAEQFSTLRTTLGSILGIFTLMRYFRTLLAKITGRPPPADATSLTPSAFASFQGHSYSSSSSGPSLLPNGQPAPSKKPFLIFLAAIIGLPYLMSKLIRSLAAQSQSQQPQPHQEGQMLLGPDGHPLPPDQYPQQKQLPLDPSKLDFCRVLYDYPPPDQPHPLQSNSSMELSVKANDIVAVLSKADPMGNESEWWQCRARDHSVGYLPVVYLEPILKKPVEQIEAHSRVNTLSSVLGGGGGKEESDGSRANSLEGGLKQKEKVLVGK